MSSIVGIALVIVVCVLIIQKILSTFKGSVRDKTPKKVQKAPDPWFFQVETLRDKPNALLDPIRTQYQIGDVLKSILSEFKTQQLSDELRVMIFGVPGSGKSSLFVSMATTWATRFDAGKSAEILWTMRKIHRPSSQRSLVTPVSLDLASFVCELKKPEAANRNQRIVFLDTRGLVTVDNEVVELFMGDFDSDRIYRRGDREERPVYQRVSPIQKNKCNLALLVIQAGADDDECRKMSELRHLLERLYVPYQWVITKGDCQAENDLADKLGISEADLIRVVNYIPSERVVCEEKHKNLEYLMARVVQRADAQGLHLRKPSKGISDFIKSCKKAVS